jgi:hypothetical protein
MSEYEMNSLQRNAPSNKSIDYTRIHYCYQGAMYSNDIELVGVCPEI